MLRELGIVLPVGAMTALKRIPAALEDEAVPPMPRQSLQAVLAEIHELDARATGIEKQLAALSRHHRACVGCVQPTRRAKDDARFCSKLFPFLQRAAGR